MQHIQRMEKGLGELKRLKHPACTDSSKYAALISTTHAFVRCNLFPAVYVRTMKINLTVTQVREIHRTVT